MSNQATAPADATFASLIDGEPPPAAEVHALPNQVGWESDVDYRTILVTRTDGSRWYCRAILPSRLSSKTTKANTVSPMPGGRTFCTGYYVVDRDHPKQFQWIIAPLRIEWSKARDLVFFFEYNRIVAYGASGLLWKITIAEADYEQDLLFDFISDGKLRFAARQADVDANGDPVFMSYAIDVASGTISSKWPSD